MRSNFLKGSIAAVLTALLIGSPQLAFAQVILADSALAPANRIGVGQVLSAVSTDVGIYVRYVGTDTGTATVAVAAGGDITFIENGAASTSFECPVSGALGGIIDVSDTACDTVGEVVDTINGKCAGCVKSKWVAAPHAMLRSESSDNTLITLSAANAKVPYGLGLLKDTSVALNMAVVLNERYDDEGTSIGIQNYLAGPEQKRLPVNPFKNTSTAFLFGSGLMTTTDNVANTLDVYCVIPKNSDSGNDSETVRTLYAEASGATTVVGTVNEVNNGIGAVCRGGKLLFRIDGNTTLTVPTLVASGYTFPNRP